MKRIKIKFLGLGYNEFCQANITIYDSNNSMIYQGETYNSEITICLKEYNIYRLKAKSLDETIDVYFYVSNMDYYIFIFNRAKFISNQSRMIAFLLTDYYYDNLQIGKGELYLWKK